MSSTTAQVPFPLTLTRGWRAAAFAGFLLVSLVSSVGFPLLTYTLSLALFGLAHVMSEMRFVRARFGQRLQRWLLAALSILLTGVVGLRVARIAGVLEAAVTINLELILVVALALIPEAIGFSIIAGVDPRVGLFASFTMAVTIAIVGGRPAMISAIITGIPINKMQAK